MGHLDEGLAQLSAEIRREWPNVVIYYIGDKNHSTNPRVSQHAMDDGKSGGPGDTPGEYDAIDVMPGTKAGQPRMADLRRIFDNLREDRDPRLFYMIIDDQIVSSVTRPWVVRDYGGTKHTHLHVSVNDKFKANRADWKWEDEVAREVEFIEVTGKLPILLVGDEDAELPGWNHVGRAQALLNYQGNQLDVDGVYGAKTALALVKLMEGKSPTTKSGGKIGEAEWRVLFGLSK